MTDYQGFYNKLNTSQCLDEINQRFSDYRYEVTNIIEELLIKKQSDSGNLLVFGAGNLMDIDYKRLIKVKKSLKVHLTDIDQLSMERGLDYLNLESDAVKITSFNYLGGVNIENNINLLINQLNLPMISKEESLSRMNSFFESVLKDFRNYSFHDIIGGSYDIIVVMPIYTQLLYLELVDKLSHTKGFKHIQGDLLQQMIYVIDEFNQKVVTCLKEDGLLVVLSDIIEEDSHVNQKELSKNGIKEKIETYEKTYGVGLGSFGLLNISEYVKPLKDYYINWEFNAERRFLVKGLLLSH